MTNPSDCLALRVVRIALNGVSYQIWQNRLRTAASRRGLAVHIKRDGEAHIIAWTEKRA